MSSFSHRLALAAWYALPALALIVAMLASHGISQFAALRGIMPFLPWFPLYYWSLKSPERLPYILLFVLGLLQDALTGLPLGLSALFWMGLRWLAASVPKEFQEMGFLVAWGFFALLVFCLLNLEWLSMRTLQGGAQISSLVMLQYVLSVLLYPSFHRAAGAVNKLFYRRVWFLLKG